MIDDRLHDLTDPIDFLERMLAAEETKLAAIRSAIETLRDHQADMINDLAHLGALKKSLREVRAVFATHGVSADLPWTEWIAAVRAHLAEAALRARHA